jgi:amidohydrolase
LDIKKKIKNLAAKFTPEVIAIRRHLHSYPELSFQEFKTVQFVAEKLKSIGLTPQEGIANTGLTVHIAGNNPTKRTVALRADMDALPILEANDVPYKSQNEGVMHACGHDVHTASLLGTALILNELREEFEGTVKCIFQPGEEKTPGGASMMIQAGVLKGFEHFPAPQSIIGQHVAPQVPVGKIGFREGLYMASADELYLTVKGKGGHGAMPELGIDPVLIASHIIVAMQQIISRNNSPKMPSVLSFGKVIANGATNVIPNEVYIEGTFRTYDEVWRKEAHQRIRKIAEGIAEAMGGACEVNIMVGYPHLKNHPDTTRRLRLFAEEYMGQDNIVDLDLWLAAEDFAYYSQEIEACFYRLGTRNEAKGIISGVHTPTFDIDEEALTIGSGLMSWLAVKELGV